ncbi:unnamed protein product [Closterium sp. NIES-53]
MSPPIPTKASAVSLAANHHHRSASGVPNAKRQRCSDGSVAAEASPEKAADMSRPKSCFIMLEEDGDDEITAADIAWCDDGSCVEIDTDALFALDEEPSAKTRSAHDSEQLSDELSQEHRGASHERQGNGGSGSSCESGETLSEKQNKSGEEGSAKRTSKEGRSKRKVKVDWTPSLHRKFVQAVEALGVERAIPSRILELMGDAALTRHNIASHLQKYRSHRRHLLAKEAEAATLHARAPAHAPPPDPSSWTPLRRDGTAWVPASVASSVLSPRTAQTAVGIPPAHAGAMAAGHAGIMSPRGNVAVGFPPTFPQSSAAHAGMPAQLAGAGVGGTVPGMLPGGGRVVIGRPVTGACGPRSLLRVMPSANGAPASAATAGTPGMSGTMLGMPLHLWGRSPPRAEQANASARGWGSLQTGVPAHGSAGGAGGSGTVMMGGTPSSAAWYGNGCMGGGAPTGYHHHHGFMHPQPQQAQQAQQGYPMGMHVDAWGRPMATLPQQQQYPQQLQASPYMSSSSSYGMPYHMSYPMPSPDAAAAAAASTPAAAASTPAAAGPYSSAMLVYPGAAAVGGQHPQHNQHHTAAPFACSSPCSSLGSLPGFPAASSSTATTSHSARTCSDASPAAAAPPPAAEAPAVTVTAAAAAVAGGLAEAAAGDLPAAAAAATAAGGDDSSAGDNKPDADACAGAASDAATKGEDCAAGMQQQQAKEEEEEQQEQVQQVKQEQGVVEEQEEDPEALFADSLFHDHDDLSLLLHMPSSPVHDPNSTTDALDLLNHFPSSAADAGAAMGLGSRSGTGMGMVGMGMSMGMGVGMGMGMSIDAALSHLMWTEGYMGGSGTESDDDEVAECKSVNPDCLKPIAPPPPTQPTPVL